jgi:hypothetical protein
LQFPLPVWVVCLVWFWVALLLRIHSRNICLLRNV